MENIERDTLEVDILFIGAGPASLAGALRLRQLINKHNGEHGGALGEITIAVIEKSREIGSHIISGAVMDIRPLAELLPDYKELGAPLEAEVGKEDVSYLTRRFKIRSPIIPPPLRNHGKYVVSLNKIVRWLGPIVEAADVMLIPEFPGAELLYDENNRVIGVRTGDKGIGKDGKPKDVGSGSGRTSAALNVFHAYRVRTLSSSGIFRSFAVIISPISAMSSGG